MSMFLLERKRRCAACKSTGYLITRVSLINCILRYCKQTLIICRGLVLVLKVGMSSHWAQLSDYSFELLREVDEERYVGVRTKSYVESTSSYSRNGCEWGTGHVCTHRWGRGGRALRISLCLKAFELRGVTFDIAKTANNLSFTHFRVLIWVVSQVRDSAPSRSAASQICDHLNAPDPK